MNTSNLAYSQAFFSFVDSSQEAACRPGRRRRDGNRMGRNQDGSDSSYFQGQEISEGKAGRIGSRFNGKTK